jgi:hypothetical protein
MYPNPVSERVHLLNLEFKGVGNQEVKVVLLDVLGREILVRTEVNPIETVQLDTQRLPAGTYFVQVWQQGAMRLAGMVMKL